MLVGGGVGVDFALEEHDKPEAPTNYRQDVLTKAHPRSYIGGFMEACSKRTDVELAQRYVIALGRLERWLRDV